MTGLRNPLQRQTQTALQGLNTNLQDGGLTVQELRARDLNQNGQLEAGEVNGLNINSQDLESINARYANHVSEPNQVLFRTVELNPTIFPGGVDGINPNDIQQGALGDCFFLAPLASMAEHRPQDILDMVQQHDRNHFTVTFPGAKYPIEVDLIRDDIYAGTGRDSNNRSNQSRWVKVLESAFVKYAIAEGLTANTMFVNPNSFAGRYWGLNDPQEAFSNGGLTHGMSVLTGHGLDFQFLMGTRAETIERRIQEAEQSGELMMASTFLDGSEDNNLMSEHMYTILGFDEESQTIIIRNPHGNGSDAINIAFPDTTDDGIFRLTTEEFKEYFNSIVYESTPGQAEADFENFGSYFGPLGEDLARTTYRSLEFTMGSERVQDGYQTLSDLNNFRISQAADSGFRTVVGRDAYRNFSDMILAIEEGDLEDAAVNYSQGVLGRERYQSFQRMGTAIREGNLESVAENYSQAILGKELYNDIQSGTEVVVETVDNVVTDSYNGLKSVGHDIYNFFWGE